MKDWIRVQRALKYATRNLGQNVMLCELAAQTHQSLFHAHRTLRTALGETPQALHVATACGSRDRSVGQLPGFDSGHRVSVRIREPRGFLPRISTALSDESERLPQAWADRN